MGITDLLLKGAVPCAADGGEESAKKGEVIPPKMMASMIRACIIGNHSAIETPYGRRTMTYGDYTASGRMTSMTEDFMRYEVAPMYANTHTELSATGRQTNHFREEGRAIIQTFLHAEPETYAVLFCGTGMTGCLHKLIDCLGIRLPSHLEDTFNLMQYIPQESRPVVFHGPMEHHSNICSWRETIADVIEIPEVRSTGKMDLAFLKRELAKYKNRPQRIVTFSAGSNVTGIVHNVAEVARVAKAGNALCFVDHAGSAPYMNVGMHPESDLSLDAIFMSPHKFVAGPGSSGVLIVKRSLLTNRVPSQPGGGTVTFVSKTHTDYADSIEAREDGGTPAILQAIRAGLAFQVRKLVTVELASDLSWRACEKAIKRWAKHPNIYLMGSDRSEYWSSKRLPIVSFNILMPEFNGSARDKPPADPSFLGTRKMLHPHFVCAILNDLYGIQSRSGCSCAGPYGTTIWNMDVKTVDKLRGIVLRSGLDAAKPGWCRVNMCWTMTDEEVEFLIEALEQVAAHAWKLLPLYATDWRSGAYQHRSWNPNNELQWICIVCAGMRRGEVGGDQDDEDAPERSLHLAQALEIYKAAKELSAAFVPEIMAPGGNFIEGNPGVLSTTSAADGDAEAIQWMRSTYAFPSDGVELLGLAAEKEPWWARSRPPKSELVKPNAKTRLMEDGLKSVLNIFTRGDMFTFSKIAHAATDRKGKVDVRSS
mmetsp:Transcript_7283/g.19824  ORF Transcript_7283/g.19824 Transcript_7283/m.19824 type:complete len:707 (+) Transcript_7283:70-2190(+)